MVKKDSKSIGTLVPIFSLQSSKQSKSDQGTFATGVIFLDWLHKTKQTVWQVLPLNERQFETGSSVKRVPSPYKGYGIGLSARYLSSEYLLIKPTVEEINKFFDNHKFWLKDYALFCALAEYFHTDDWSLWEEGIKNRHQSMLDEWEIKLKERIDYFIIQQWQLHTSYAVLRLKAHALNISLIGDLPYYMSFKSPLVWSHQDVFQLDNSSKMIAVSGIPNTFGTLFGRQVWGHPLYNWKNRKSVLAFWKMRLSYQSKLFDYLRFDHAKAFFAYGVLDPRNEKKDAYVKGPGSVVFTQLIKFCQSLKLTVFAEDSGDRTEELKNYLKKLSIPGIKIYWFAINKRTEKLNNSYAELAQYPENCVAYSTTHDTQTLVDFLNNSSTDLKKELASTAVVSYNPDDNILAIDLRQAIINSPARTVIIALQDWMLTRERINIPGTELEKNDPNWQFIMPIPIEQLPLEL